MSKEKKYRFYFSQKQNNIDEEMWSMPTRFVFVKTPDGYKQYSELCSIKGSKCNWNDAELVYETDDNPEIIVHENVPKLIIDLEAKLAESEKLKDDAMYNYAWLNQDLSDTKEQLKVEKDAFKVLSDNYNTLSSAYDQLKQQLAEKDAEVQSWKDGTMVVKLGKLEEQLAEKEKFLEQIMSGEYIPANIAEKSLNLSNQTAIAELEKAKEKVLKIDKTEIKTLENGWSVLYVDEAEVITVINQQIAELKGDADV